MKVPSAAGSYGLHMFTWLLEVIYLNYALLLKVLGCQRPRAINMVGSYGLYMVIWLLEVIYLNYALLLKVLSCQSPRKIKINLHSTFAFPMEKIVGHLYSSSLLLINLFYFRNNQQKGTQREPIVGQQ